LVLFYYRGETRGFFMAISQGKWLEAKITGWIATDWIATE
jgi:hypothetical protein